MKAVTLPPVGHRHRLPSFRPRQQQVAVAAAAAALLDAFLDFRFNDDDYNYYRCDAPLE